MEGEEIAGGNCAAAGLDEAQYPEGQRIGQEKKEERKKESGIDASCPKYSLVEVGGVFLSFSHWSPCMSGYLNSSKLTLQ